MAIPQLYSVRETCDKLSISRSTLIRWLDKGILGCHVIGGSLRIPEQEISRLLREGWWKVQAKVKKG